MRQVLYVSAAVVAVLLMAGCGWVPVVSGVQPPAGGVLTYDAKHGEVVLFVPARPSRAVLLGPGQTWTFDGGTRRWVQRHPSIEPAVSGFMSFDGQSSTVVLLGGIHQYASCDDTLAAQTWTWDGTTWTQQHPASAPDECSARGNTTMTYDPATRQLLFASDQYGSGGANDWVWNTKTWRPVGDSMGGAAVAYDPSCKALVAFGGLSGPEPLYRSYAETDLWNGRRWTQLLSGDGPNQPLARGDAGLTFDSARNALIMYGGLTVVDGTLTQAVHDTWEFVKCRTWTRLPVISLPQLKAPGGNLVYDTRHHFALLVTGHTSWLFN